MATFNSHPHPNVEFGATFLNHFGGRGMPSVSLVHRLEDIFLVYPQGEATSDKAFGANAALTLPAIRTRVHVQMMLTDDHNLLRDRALVTEAVWAAGAQGADGRTDLWLEGHYAGVRPYTHHQYTSGLTLDRRIIGDAIGPLGEGLTAGVDWRGSEHTFGVESAWERYSGADFYRDDPGDARLAWNRVIDNPDEIRVRVQAKWRTDPHPGRVTPSFRAGFERVTRFAFGVAGRSNFLAEMKLEYRP